MWNPLEPPEIQQVRALVSKAIVEAKETFDRRGFRLLQWPSARTTQKPIELSLEHEARLLALDDTSVAHLLQDLDASENLPLGDTMLPGSQFAGLVVQRYKRPPGPQSTDRYHDVPSAKGRVGVIEQLFTIRERLKTSDHMTWANKADPKHTATENELRPLNLELPFVTVGPAGMTARLEFNWLDDISQSLACAHGENATPEEQMRNPFHLVALATGLSIPALEPMIEHTTERHKFKLYDLESDNQVFALNVDFVSARDLSSMIETTYTDIDVSGVNPVDAAEFARVSDFSSALALRYKLAPNRQTKASRGLLALKRGK